jgi:hypothetical protein
MNVEWIFILIQNLDLVPVFWFTVLFIFMQSGVRKLPCGLWVGQLLWIDSSGETPNGDACYSTCCMQKPFPSTCNSRECQSY